MVETVNSLSRRRSGSCLTSPHVYGLIEKQKRRRIFTCAFSPRVAEALRSARSRVMAKSEQRFSGQPKGTVMVVEFELDGNEFLGLNGGPHFKFTPAVSFIVNCKKQ